MTRPECSPSNFGGQFSRSPQESARLLLDRTWIATSSTRTPYLNAGGLPPALVSATNARRRILTKIARMGSMLCTRKRPFLRWLYRFGQDRFGFSAVGANCLFNFSHTHEFGHNMGADHDREHAYNDKEYSHGMRYCSGSEP